MTTTAHSIAFKDVVETAARTYRDVAQSVAVLANVQANLDQGHFLDSTTVDWLMTHDKLDAATLARRVFSAEATATFFDDPVGARLNTDVLDAIRQEHGEWAAGERHAFVLNVPQLRRLADGTLVQDEGAHFSVLLYDPGEGWHYLDSAGVGYLAHARALAQYLSTQGRLDQQAATATLPDKTVVEGAETQENNACGFFAVRFVTHFLDPRVRTTPLADLRALFPAFMAIDHQTMGFPAGTRLSLQLALVARKRVTAILETMHATWVGAWRDTASLGFYWVLVAAAALTATEAAALAQFKLPPQLPDIHFWEPNAPFESARRELHDTALRQILLPMRQDAAWSVSLRSLLAAAGTAPGIGDAIRALLGPPLARVWPTVSDARALTVPLRARPATATAAARPGRPAAWLTVWQDAWAPGLSQQGRVFFSAVLVLRAAYLEALALAPADMATASEFAELRRVLIAPLGQPAVAPVPVGPAPARVVPAPLPARVVPAPAPVPARVVPAPAPVPARVVPAPAPAPARIVPAPAPVAPAGAAPAPIVPWGGDTDWVEMPRVEFYAPAAPVPVRARPEDTDAGWWTRPERTLGQEWRALVARPLAVRQAEAAFQEAQDEWRAFADARRALSRAAMAEWRAPTKAALGSRAARAAVRY